jgi:hypothetical protein
MTVQLAPRTAALYGKSKATLQAALTETPFRVAFDDPSMFSPRHGGCFNGTNLTVGEKFAVVMDPAKRTRFATIELKPDGKIKVS